jgi:hypothetical protein
MIAAAAAMARTGQRGGGLARIDAAVGVVALPALNGAASAPDTVAGAAPTDRALTHAVSPSRIDAISSSVRRFRPDRHLTRARVQFTQGRGYL